MDFHIPKWLFSNRYCAVSQIPNLLNGSIKKDGYFSESIVAANGIMD